MNRRRLVLSIVALVLAGAAVLFWWLRPPSVEVVSVEKRDLQQTLVVAGRIRPTSVAELGSAIAGIVQEVRVREGSRVARGEVVVRLVDEEQRSSVAQAEARLVEVRAFARDEIRRAEIEAEQARRDLERVRSVLAGAMEPDGFRAVVGVGLARTLGVDVGGRIRIQVAGGVAASIPSRAWLARPTDPGSRARPWRPIVRHGPPGDVPYEART